MNPTNTDITVRPYTGTGPNHPFTGTGKRCDVCFGLKEDIAHQLTLPLHEYHRATDDGMPEHD